MIDIAKLRALMAAAFKDVLPLRIVGYEGDMGSNWGVEDVNEFAVANDLHRIDAEALAAAVNALPGILDELEALRTERDKAIGDRDEAEAVLSTMLEQAAEVDRHLEALVEGKPTSVCSFCHALSENVPEKVQAHMLACEKHPLRAATQELEVLRPLPRILDSYRILAEKDHDRLTAWRTATGCDGPEQAEQLARDAVVVREGHWDALLAEREQWKSATGCDTPAEAATLRQQRDDAERNLTAPTRGHLAELDAELSRLRELEAAALDLDAVHAEPMHEGMDWQAMGERRRVARARMSAAIAACRAAICTGVLCEDALTPEGLCSSCNRPRAVAGKL